MGVTVITGSASGIGASVYAQYREAGKQVVGIDRQGADVVADLSTEAGRKDAVAAVLKTTGGVIDGLVCCAGLGPTAPSSGLIVSVNYFGVRDLVEGLAGALEKGDHPAVLVVGSVASVHPGMDKLPMVGAMLSGDEREAKAQADQMGVTQAAYAGSKYAIAVYARKKALDFGPRGIRLNVLAPGAVDTPLLKASLEDERYGEAVRNFVAPLGRNASPDEIARAAAFLMSSDASFVHGTVVFADGGMDAMTRPDRF